jgi:NADH:ubiquinone oxidoreductase subunit F (NADH-binding)
VELDGERLLLSKEGAVHGVPHRPVEGTLVAVTLTRSRTGKWYTRRDEANLQRVQKLKDAAKNAQRWEENRRT